MKARKSYRIHSACLALFGLALFSPLHAFAEIRVVPESMEEVQLSFSPVVKRVAPAVVNVYTKRIIQTRPTMRDDPFFDFFFGRNRMSPPRQRIQNSLGSGVIVRSDGLIVTNNHVIQGGDQYTVVLTDRREFDAELVLADERTDLAVLRIDTKGEELPSLSFADSDQAEVGDLVLAIGDPFGVGQTVTSGIVSAVARTQVGISDFQFFIQTDAAINPGNSGGALVNMTGDLVGINSAIFSRSGGSNGIGFAIPANMVRSVVKSAVTGGAIVRPWLGIKGQVVTSDLAESLGLDRPVGVLVNSLHSSSPALEAGLREGDVILAVDEFDVFDPTSLNYRVATKAVGDRIELSYLRTKSMQKASVELVAPPEDPPRDLTELTGNHPLSGVTLANLSPAFAEEMGFDWLQEGAVVVGTARNSAASRLGLKPGDILLSINDREVATVRQAKTALGKNRSRWAISIRRGDRTLSVTVRG